LFNVNWRIGFSRILFRVLGWIKSLFPAKEAFHEYTGPEKVMGETEVDCFGQGRPGRKPHDVLQAQYGQHARLSWRTQ
jgi:hypothetical protein